MWGLNIYINILLIYNSDLVTLNGGGAGGSSPVVSVNHQLILKLNWLHQAPVHYNKAHNGQ